MTPIRGKLDHALPLFRRVFALDPIWRDLVPASPKPASSPPMTRSSGGYRSKGSWYNGHK
jgi:hypothetical protein